MFVVVDVVLALGVGVGSVAGAGEPVVSMCPASTETASVRLRIVTAHICRKVFTFEPPKSLQKVCKQKPDKHDRSERALQGADGLR